MKVQQTIQQLQKNFLSSVAYGYANGLISVKPPTHEDVMFVRRKLRAQSAAENFVKKSKEGK